MFSKFRRNDDASILTAPNPTSTDYNIHLETSLRHDNIAIGRNTIGAGFNETSVEYRICDWLKTNSVWFNDEVGNALMKVLISNTGITNPDTELKLLKEWPDLIQISDLANLNIIQRRRFINSIHDPMSRVKREEDMGFFIPGPKEYANTYNIPSDRDQNEDVSGDKHILVMSDKEQEALARIDSIISQLFLTRNLIRRRCEALDSGAIECESTIREEFAFLRQLLSEREDQIINELHTNKSKRITQLNGIENGIEYHLAKCKQTKSFVERIFENDTRNSGASWAVLMARKHRAVQAIESCIDETIDISANAKDTYYSISNLIHTDMDIDNLLAFQTHGTAQNIDVGMTKIHDSWAIATVSDSVSENEKKSIVLSNLLKLNEIEKQRFGDGENSYASHELNVFMRSLAQVRLRMSLPGFSFQHNKKQIHNRIRKYGNITDVEKSVDNQCHQLFKSIAKVPQHTYSAIKVNIDKAIMVNEISKNFDDEIEIYKFYNHRSLSVQVSVGANPENAVKAAQIINKRFENSDSEDSDQYNGDYNDSEPVSIYRIFECELQICRQPIPPKEAIDKYMRERKRRDSYDSEEENKANKTRDYDLNEIDPTLLSWVSLGWKPIIRFGYDKDGYDEEHEKIRKNIEIEFSEEWWKQQRVNLLSKVDLDEWPLRPETGKPSSEIASIIDDQKSVDNIICNDLLIRCRVRDFVKVEADQILVSQSSYSHSSFMKYDLRLPPEEPQNHYGIICLFSDRSLRFYDLYDNKLIILTQGVPGDHKNLPGLCCGLIPYRINCNSITGITGITTAADNSDSDNSDSDTLSLKPDGSMTNLMDNDSEAEYELKPTIIRCGGTLSAQPTSFVDLFDIEQMSWTRIKHSMKCKRVYCQSLIINGKLVVIGGEHFESKAEVNEEVNVITLTRRISAINEDNDENTAFSSILRVQENKSCIEEYDFELQRWDITCILPVCIWQHSICAINNSNTVDNGIVTQIFIGGGYVNMRNQYSSQCMLYDMMKFKDNVTNMPSMKYLHSMSSAISFDFSVNEQHSMNHRGGNKVYMIGGMVFNQSPKNNSNKAMLSKQFQCVEVYDLKTKKWHEIDSLNCNHGFYPSVWIQNLLDYKQKKSKEEKERLKRMSKMSKMSKENSSIDPKPIYTIFVSGNGCNNQTNVEYLDPKTQKWKILSKEIGDIEIGKVRSIKNELFKSRRFTPYPIRDDILERFDKKQKQNNNKYIIIDEL